MQYRYICSLKGVNATFTESIPTVHPIGNVEGAVRPESQVGCQDFPKWPLVVDHFKTGAIGFKFEGSDSTVSRSTTKIAEQESDIEL